MKDSYEAYNESIMKGLAAARVLLSRVSEGSGTVEEREARLADAIKNSEAVLIGAGAGLSTSAGFVYSGERFRRYFFDFEKRFGIRDMYSGGFFPFPDEQTRWAWWARHIYFNRFAAAPKPAYERLLDLVREKEYFVITTNVDHQFQRAGFDGARLFCTQGDYGLFQPADGGGSTFENEGWVMRAMEAQGFVKDEKGEFTVPPGGRLAMLLPKELIPRTPEGLAVSMNLRSDDTFVEDGNWHRACAAYTRFLEAHSAGRMLYLELGVGGNTPMIIKFPFWQMTLDNPEAVYACVNYGEAFCPARIEDRSVCINGDIYETLLGIKA